MSATAAVSSSSSSSSRRSSVQSSRSMSGVSSITVTPRSSRETVATQQDKNQQLTFSSSSSYKTEQKEHNDKQRTSEDDYDEDDYSSDTSSVHSAESAHSQLDRTLNTTTNKAHASASSASLATLLALTSLPHCSAPSLSQSSLVESVNAHHQLRETRLLQQISTLTQQLHAAEKLHQDNIRVKHIKRLRVLYAEAMAVNQALLTKIQQQQWMKEEEIGQLYDQTLAGCSTKKEIQLPISYAQLHKKINCLIHQNKQLQQFNQTLKQQLKHHTQQTQPLAALAQQMQQAGVVQAYESLTAEHQLLMNKFDTLQQEFDNKSKSLFQTEHQLAIIKLQLSQCKQQLVETQQAQQQDIPAKSMHRLDDYERELIRQSAHADLLAAKKKQIVLQERVRKLTQQLQIKEKELAQLTQTDRSAHSVSSSSVESLEDRESAPSSSLSWQKKETKYKQQIRELQKMVDETKQQRSKYAKYQADMQQQTDKYTMLVLKYERLCAQMKKVQRSTGEGDSNVNDDPRILDVFDEEDPAVLVMVDVIREWEKKEQQWKQKMHELEQRLNVHNRNTQSAKTHSRHQDHTEHQQGTEQQQEEDQEEEPKAESVYGDEAEAQDLCSDQSSVVGEPCSEDDAGSVEL